MQLKLEFAKSRELQYILQETAGTMMYAFVPSKSFLSK
jgi:hypothetical protein